jgi:hypothetical protein
MKRAIRVLFFCTFVSICVHVPDTMAVGLGLYGTSGTGDGEYEFDDDASVAYDLDVDIQRGGFGFVLDTAVANDRMFNYQLNIGIYNWSEEFENDAEFDLSGLMMSHDFGFGVLRNRHVRLWLGPEIRIAYGTGDDADNDGYDVNIVSLGAGPVLGVNLHLGPVVSLGFKSGYLFESVFGTADGDGVESIDFYGGDEIFFFTLSLIFRIGDAF